MHVGVWFVWLACLLLWEIFLSSFSLIQAKSTKLAQSQFKKSGLHAPPPTCYIFVSPLVLVVGQVIRH